MGKIKKILACIDLSEYSWMTLDCAVELAKNADAQIIVLSVVNQRDISAVEMVNSYYPSSVFIETYIKDLKKDRHERLRQFIKNNFFDEKSRMSILIDTGVPAECILWTAEEEKADLIVMANKGKGNLSRMLFGSAAEKVFRHAPVPVVSVREKDRFKRK